MDLFEMAAAYVESVCTHHPFVDGNKRTGTVCALTFLLLNGHEVDEQYDEELADKVLDLVTHKTDRQALADYFRDRSRQTELGRTIRLEQTGNKAADSHSLSGADCPAAQPIDLNLRESPAGAMVMA